MSRTACGKMSPYAATTKTSGRNDRSFACASGAFKLVGWTTSMAWRRAHCFTALVVGARLLPAGRSGWVKTATNSCPAATSASSAGTANAGVPAKTMRIQREAPCPRGALGAQLTLSGAAVFPTWRGYATALGVTDTRQRLFRAGDPSHAECTPQATHRPLAQTARHRL